MRNFFTKLFAVALGLVLATSAFAQVPGPPSVLQIRPAVGLSDRINAVSTDTMMYVKYVGDRTTVTGTTVAVSAGGAISFVVGGSADPTVTCPFGGTPGTIDNTNAACDTVGEAIDAINFSRNWVAVPAGALRSTSIASASGQLITLSAADATSPLGVALLRDSTIALEAYAAPQPLQSPGAGGLVSPGFASIDDWLQEGSTSVTPYRVYPKNPFAGLVSRILYASVTATLTGASNNFEVLGVIDTFLPKGQGSAQPTAAATPSYVEYVRTIHSQAGPATATEGVIDYRNAGGIVLNVGERPLVRHGAVTTYTAVSMSAVGYAYSAK